VTPDPAAPRAAPPPGLWRRLACFTYEGVLLFGVVMVTGLLYAIITRQNHALVGQHGLQAVIFVVLGAYFVWFWTRSGQTLAMQTWQIRLLRRDGRPVGARQAALRYLLAWMWFLPALAWLGVTGLKGTGPVLATVTAGVLTYAALARLHPRRQYLHDTLCGTELVFWPAPGKR